MKTILAVIGALTLVLATFGALGVGHFQLCYAPTAEDCK